MGSNRDRDDSLSFNNTKSYSSSPITVSDPIDSFLGDANSGSFQGDGLLGGVESVSSSSDPEFGFARPEFRSNQLAGTVQFYERHVFLCYKKPSVWPPRIEAAEFDRLPRLLSAAVSARKGDMKRETRLTICEGHDGTETSNGDVLIFPDMIRYRRLTHFDVDTFVEEVLVKNGEWLPGTPETLNGTYIFVCSHGSRDRRCGVCGPALVSRFREEREIYGLQGKLSISACSHIGGHKYAGNVIIFQSNINGEVTGHWYGYVSPEDVPLLVERHIGRGEILDSLWRGQMGLTEEEQKKSQEMRLQLNDESNVERSNVEVAERQTEKVNSYCGSQVESMGCCQETTGNGCCQSKEKIDDDDDEVTAFRTVKLKPKIGRMNSGKGGSSTRKVCSMPTWFESWEREDTYAALAVVSAALSVAYAYNCYKQLR